MTREEAKEVKVDMTKEEIIRRLESIKETFETFACELDDIHLDKVWI